MKFYLWTAVVLGLLSVAVAASAANAGTNCTQTCTTTFGTRTCNTYCY